jgi:hypothetical protein
VAIVERLLPRHWDGRRLLRFLAGLALFAMSLTLPADVATPASSPASVSAEARATVSAASASSTENDQASKPAAVPVPAAVVLVGVEPAAGEAVAGEPVRMLDSECQHDAAPRAPPLA